MNHRLASVSVGCVAALFTCVAAFGHELRPALLDLLEERDGEYSVLWKTPMRGDMLLSLTPEFSGDVMPTSDVSTRERSGAAIQAWTLRASALRGQTLRIRGLEGTMTDAVVRITFADGDTWTHLLTPRSTAVRIPEFSEISTASAPIVPTRFPLFTALAAWAMVCAASAAVRSRRRTGWRWAIVGLSYAVGIGGVFFLLRALVKVIGLA